MTVMRPDEEPRDVALLKCPFPFSAAPWDIRLSALMSSSGIKTMPHKVFKRPICGGGDRSRPGGKKQKDKGYLYGLSYIQYKYEQKA